MKNIRFLLILLVSFSANAEWVFVSDDSIGNKFYIDLSSIKIKKTVISAWVYQDWPKPDKLGDSSAKVLTEYDCKNKISRNNHFITFSMPGLKGKQSSNNKKDGDWAPVPRDSILEGTFEPICEKEGLNKITPYKLPAIAKSITILENKNADWVFLETGEHGSKFFIDKKSVEKKGTMTMFWLKTEFIKNPFNALSTKILHEADCKKRMIRTVYIEGYEFNNLQGKKLAGAFLEEGDPTQTFEKVKKNSIEDFELSFACK
jgi:hypothetical protein